MVLDDVGWMLDDVGWMLGRVLSRDFEGISGTPWHTVGTPVAHRGAPWHTVPYRGTPWHTGGTP